VNDIFDYETDKLNPKKQGYEELVRPEDRPSLWSMIVLTHLPYVLGLFFIDTRALLFLGAFLFFSLGYSVPPLRAKARPFFDSVFNVLYVFPAFFAYALAGGGLPAWHIVCAAWLWVMAMHAFSAVPDIAADTSAKVHTIATRLGARTTLIFCASCYLLCGILSYASLAWFGVLLGVFYGALMLLALRSQNIMRIYRWFPSINTAVGFLLFLFLALQLF
jgi:4-hydroxybenzoate polyprenyltransferase